MYCFCGSIELGNSYSSGSISVGDRDASGVGVIVGDIVAATLSVGDGDASGVGVIVGDIVAATSSVGASVGIELSSAI